VTAGAPVTVPPRHRRRHRRATLTPRLPGAGRRRDQARWDANGRVGGVAGIANVVTVVVKTVVRSRVAARLRHATRPSST
jgi:hypothetical protein